MTALPVFETQRLILRAPTEENAADWQKNFVDYEVVRNLSAAVPWPYPEDGVLTFLKNFILPNQGNNRWVWGIFLKENPQELIGAVDLWRARTADRPENRGFWLARKHWKKGIMTEAVEPVMDYAFNELGFTELFFSNAVQNIGSRRVKEKTGATFIRVQEAKFVDPALTHTEVWELKKEDWFKFKKSAHKLELRELTEKDEEAFLKAYHAWEDKKGFIFAQAYTPDMKFTDYLLHLNHLKEGKDLPANFVPGTSLFAFVGSEIVGRSSIRHGLNDFLLKVGGHVGYGVLPKHRRNGYAKLMLKGSLEYCSKHLGLKKVLVTCDDDNIGSIKTIESANAVLENKIETEPGKPLKRRYWIQL